jgi:hypothetical protein
MARNSFAKLMTVSFSRTLHSLVNYGASPLFIRNKPVLLKSKQSIPNLLPLQAYDSCPIWKQDVGNNNRTLEEKNMFQLGHQMQALLQNVSERLGFGYRLTFGVYYVHSSLAGSVL